MQVPAAAELLKVWEWGQTQPAVQRAMGLLMVGWPEESTSALAGLSIGQRDGRLLQLRQSLFGSSLASVASCPACGEHLELNFVVADILVNVTPPPDLLTLAHAGYLLSFRLPNSQDLLNLAASEVAVTTGRNRLMESCILEAKQGDDPVSVAMLPLSLVEAVAAKMAEADPQADVQLALHCPRCSHQWELAFDIVSFLWSELQTWVERVLHDVHILALTYGWSEREILALSEWRRQYYLGMIRG